MTAIYRFWKRQSEIYWMPSNTQQQCYDKHRAYEELSEELLYYKARAGKNKYFYEYLALAILSKISDERQKAFDKWFNFTK